MQFQSPPFESDYGFVTDSFLEDFISSLWESHAPQKVRQLKSGDRCKSGKKCKGTESMADQFMVVHGMVRKRKLVFKLDQENELVRINENREFYK